MAQTREKIQWEGAADLKRLLVPVGEVSPHPDNPRRGNVEAISESLRSNGGQLKPIVVNSETGHIVAGNHTYRAAVEILGWNRVAAVRLAMTPEQERRYMLADNRTSDLGEYDVAVQARLLAELSEAGQLEGSGYDEKAVERLIADAEKAAAGATGDSNGGGGGGGESRPPLRGARSLTIDLTEAKHEKIGRYLSMLAKEWETDGPGETVYRAVEQAAKAL